MKILFVDHAFHKKTKSSNFFCDIIKDDSVEIFYFDENFLELSITTFANKCHRGDYDLVVVWQLEVLAFIPLALEIPVVVIPMYDGSANQPAKHWVALSGASILNFSYNLHLKTSNFFHNRLLVRYFPNPNDYPVCEEDSKENVFSWIRRPNELDADAMFRLSRHARGRIHFHMPADKESELKPLPEWVAAYDVTTSDWFASKADYNDLIRRYNVAICPRITEGIGMFLLEAMARGMCVIASGQPVHNEYICNNVNGILFDHGNYGGVDLSRRREIGRAARESIVNGYDRWLNDIEKIKTFITKSASVIPSAVWSKAEAKLLIDLYFNNHDAYLENLPELNMVTSSSPSVSDNLKDSLLNRLPLGSNHATKGSLEKLRSSINAIPGWSVAKKFIPNNLKIKLATKLSE